MIMLVIMILTQTWSVERLTNNYVDNSYTALVEYNDLVYISYGEGTFPSDGDLHLRIGTLGNWADTILFSSGTGFPRHPTLDIEQNGNIHIVFVLGLEGLWHATNSSGTWQISPIGFASDGVWPQIVVDNNDVHLVCATSGGVSYAKYSSGTWNIEWSTNSGQRPSITLDSLGYVHIAYDGGGIYHVTNASGSWMSELAIPSYCSRVTSPDIKVTFLGNIHIAYRADHESGPIYYALGYADNTSGSWQYSELDSAIRLSCAPSIMTDKNSYVHIVYTKLAGAQPPEIYYITDKNSLWEKFPVTSNSWWDENYFPGAFDIDASGYGHITFSGYPEGTDEVFYAKSDSVVAGVIEEDKDLFFPSQLLSVSSIFRDKILLKFTEPLNTPVNITLYNVYGSPVFKKSFHYNSCVLTLKDAKITRLSSGIYFLSVYTGKRKLAQVKLIKL